MTIRNLERLLEPRSVAVVGAEAGPGGLALANIVAGGFAGPVWPVAPDGGTLLGLPAYPRVADLPDAPDVARRRRRRPPRSPAPSPSSPRAAAGSRSSRPAASTRRRGRPSSTPPART